MSHREKSPGRHEHHSGSGCFNLLPGDAKSFSEMTGVQKMKISQIKGFISLIGCVRVMKVTHRFTTFIPEALEYTQLEDYYTS